MSTPHQPDVDAFEAELTALDHDHARRTAWAASIVAPTCMLGVLREMNELRISTEEALRALYIEPAWEPERVTRRKVAGDNGSYTS